MNSGYLTIKDFRQITGLTHKALLIYEKAGILIPAAVNPETHYRYYLSGLIPDSIRIKILRRMGVSLGEIKQFMDEKDSKKVDKYLQERTEVLNRQIWERERDMCFLHEFSIDPNKIFSEYPVSLKTVDDKIVVSISAKEPKNRFDEKVLGDRNRLLSYLQMINVTPCEKSFTLLHQVEICPPIYFEFETCVPIPYFVPENDIIKCRLVKGGSALSVNYRGSYKGIIAAYGAIMRWDGLHHEYKLNLPKREIYFTDPQKCAQEDNFTEVQWPVERIS
mgnify:CR=1 FL=1